MFTHLSASPARLPLSCLLCTLDSLCLYVCLSDNWKPLQLLPPPPPHPPMPPHPHNWKPLQFRWIKCSFHSYKPWYEGGDFNRLFGTALTFDVEICWIVDSCLYFLHDFAVIFTCVFRSVQITLHQPQSAILCAFSSRWWQATSLCSWHFWQEDCLRRFNTMCIFVYVYV